jgi:Fic family protein
MYLLSKLTEEKNLNYKGGIYHHTQIKFAFNTNRIEGSRLTEEQTRYIFETNTLLTNNENKSINIDDILETINHFKCFDYLLDIAEEKLTEFHIKKFHKLLKNNTAQSKKAWFNVGEYKAYPNEVGGKETTKPDLVSSEMVLLLNNYHNKSKIQFKDIIDFHYIFESIHPFQDGNGRVGRLIMFKECLKHGIVPFIIEDEFKMFYYRGLSEYPDIKEYLTDTCLSAQDKYRNVIDYFFPGKN